MDISTFITTIYCLTSDWFADRKLRKRGPDPLLSDPEVLTMEIVGEFLGLEEDKKIYLYFKRHWSDAFPLIGQVHRTTFSRQASNLWAIKHELWQYLLTQVETDSQLSVVDSMPIHVCRFAALIVAACTTRERPTDMILWRGKRFMAFVFMLASSGRV